MPSCGSGTWHGSCWGMLRLLHHLPPPHLSPGGPETVQKGLSGHRVAGCPCPALLFPATHLLARITMLGQPGRKGSDCIP